MAKRESKGQQVKTFKYHEAQEDGTFREAIAKVYFQAKDGDFTIWLLDHMANIVEALPIIRDSEYVGGGSKLCLGHDKRHIYSRTVDTTIEAFKTINRQYFEHLTDLTAVPVIVVEVKANLKYNHERGNKGQFVYHGSSSAGSNDIHFVGFPTVHLSYECLWRAGDKLYEKIPHAAYGDRPAYHTLRYKADPFMRVADSKRREVIEATIIPWTQEKEDFLAGVVKQIETLGWMLKDFIGDTEANITHAIASGTGQLALAPPPAPEEVTPGTDAHEGPTLDLQATPPRTRDRRR